MSGEQTVIYTTQPAANNSQSLVVGAGGTLNLTGATVSGYLPNVPSNGVYKLTVSAGTPSWTATVPNLPSGDGDYKLHISSGVATWVAIT
jgi:hypothetical protein